MSSRFIALALGALAAVAAPAAAQSHDFPSLGFRVEAPAHFAVTQDGITVTIFSEESGDRVDVTPFAVNDRDASRIARVERVFELMDYELDGSDEVRGDGSVVVTGEGGDEFDLVVVRDVYVDSDGGLRIVAFADPAVPGTALGIANAIEITDPVAVMKAGRSAGRID